MYHCKLLFLAAEPIDNDKIRCGKEYEELRLLCQNSNFHLIPRFAVKRESLISILDEIKPQFVHFCGHGDSQGNFCFENEAGKSEIVSVPVLTEIFSHSSDSISCVVFNSCASAKQAQSVARHIDFVIGHKALVYPNNAITFSTEFYRALTSDSRRTVEEAYEMAVTQWKTVNSLAGDFPYLYNSGNAKSFMTLEKLCADCGPSVGKISDHTKKQMMKILAKSEHLKTFHEAYNFVYESDSVVSFLAGNIENHPQQRRLITSIANLMLRTTLTPPRVPNELNALIPFLQLVRDNEAQGTTFFDELTILINCVEIELQLPEE